MSRVEFKEALRELFSDQAFIYSSDRWFSRYQLLSAAYRLSRQFDDGCVVVNLYQKRHLFIILALAVAMKRGRLILPPNTTRNTLVSLQVACDATSFIVVSETPLEAPDSGLQARIIDIQSLLSAPLVSKESLIPSLSALENAVIVLYTSGSTGQPKAVSKTWPEMHLLAQKAIKCFLWDASPAPYVVGTVPSQHMFGLETTVFWPLFSRATLWDERPLFPEDIKDALSFNSSGSSWLISTPLHLKKLDQFGPTWSTRKVDIVSATAELDTELAQRLRDRFNGCVHEVYGSTETASLASRSPLTSPYWRLYDGNTVLLKQGKMVVHMSELDRSYPLQDQIRLVGQHEFELRGRNDDLIKVAGKRGSLNELNRILQNVVRDGVFVQLEGRERLSAVVCSSLSATEIKRQLAMSIDPVFLPRPIYYVKALPRNELGKLPKSALNRLLEQVQNTHESPLV